MADPRSNEPTFLSRAYDNLGNAWNHIADLQLPQAGKDFIAVGTDAMRTSIGKVRAMAGSEFTPDSQTTAQKILPKALLIASLPVTVAAVAVTLVGVAALAPPFAFAASIAGVARSVSAYMDDKQSLDNLNKQLITKSDLFHKIDKTDLDPKDKQVIKNYVEAPEEIYKSLYLLRQDIIKNENLSTDQKNKLIAQVNKGIEDFNHGDFSGLSLDTGNMSAQDKHALTRAQNSINDKIQDYAAAKQSFEGIEIPSKLKKSIEQHKNTHEQLYAQDIPLKAKQDIVNLLSQQKVSKDDLDNIYAQMGNHHLNQQSETHRGHLDSALVNYLQDKNKLSDDQAKVLSDYIAKPREFYPELKRIHDQLPEDKRQQFHQDIISQFEQQPAALLGQELAHARKCEDVEKWLDANDVPKQKFSAELIKINEINQEEKNLSKAVNQLPISTQDKQDLQEHRKAQLLGQFQSRGVEVSSPKVFDKDYLKVSKVTPDAKPVRHIKEAANAIQKKVTKPFNKIFAQAKFKLLKTIHGEEKANKIMEAKKNKTQAAEEVREQFSGAHRLMRNVMEQKFLEKALPRRAVNIGLAVGGVALTGVSSFALPAMFSPAAPVAVAATVGVGALGAGLTVASIANSGDLLWKHGESHQKTADPKHQISEAILNPSLQAEKSELDQRRRSSIGNQAADTPAGPSREADRNMDNTPPRLSDDQLVSAVLAIHQKCATSQLDLHKDRDKQSSRQPEQRDEQRQEQRERSSVRMK